MIHRNTKLAMIVGMAVMAGGCHHNSVSNPIAHLDSKQPDKVLFDRAMDAMKHGKYDVARITLQTLINTYPDSEFIARAKLAVGDSWFAEGSATSYQQAEVEYKDFITFFPNLPEAAEAQLKIADMHYKQMEKPDRDYTHAMRAEDEYRILIQQFPDNTKLVPIAKQRLREVQEVLAERQYRIGHFYYLRESYPAAIARLKTLSDTYPLYSQADDALMMLGRCYENEATLIKNSKMLEAPKLRFVKQYESDAADTYSRLIQRYPISPRADDARAHLKDLGRPIPTPTKEAIAENKAEEASRSELGRFSSVMSNFHKAPNDFVRAPKVGEPPLVDPEPASAAGIMRAAADKAFGVGTNGNNNVSADKATPDAATKNDPVPRSEAAPGADTAAVAPAPTGSDSSTPATTATPPATAPAVASPNSEQGIGDLTPNVAQPTTQAAAAPSTSGTNTAGDTTANASASGATPNTPPSAPAQVNELQNGTSTSSGTASADSASSTTSADGSSSSKKKKKKGLKKLNPF
jgi:outer membrane protein assembly factor BamD